MNLIILANPPKNVASHVPPPASVCIEEGIGEWLQTSLKNGVEFLFE
jgi:hypothetical protein